MTEVSLTTKTGVILRLDHSMNDFGYELKIRFLDNTSAFMKLSKAELLLFERQVYELAREARNLEE